MLSKLFLESRESINPETSYYYHNISPYFQAYTQDYSLEKQRVLVPLYGNDKALEWYRQRAVHVIGIELVCNVGKQFLHKYNLTYEQKSGARYEADKITIFGCSIFELKSTDVGKIDLVYDRAALVGLPEDLHQKYRQKINEFMHINSRYLLII